METRVRTLLGRGRGSRVEREPRPGRSEEGLREEGLGPAAPRSPGGTRTGGASPPPPQLSGKTRPGAGAQASSFCPAHTPWPLPFPSKTCSVKLSGEPMSATGQLPQVDHSLPAWPSFLAGEESKDGLINLGPRDEFVIEDQEGAPSQALREPAPNWREVVGGEGAPGWLSGGLGGCSGGTESRRSWRKEAGEKRNRKVAGWADPGRGWNSHPRDAPRSALVPQARKRLTWSRECGGSKQSLGRHLTSETKSREITFFVLLTENLV